VRGTTNSIDWLIGSGASPAIREAQGLG